MAIRQDGTPGHINTVHEMGPLPLTAASVMDLVTPVVSGRSELLIPQPSPTFLPVSVQLWEAID